MIFSHHPIYKHTMTKVLARNYNNVNVGDVFWYDHVLVGNHMFVVIKITNNIAECIAISSRGDMFIETNMNHFIPRECCDHMKVESWCIPHRGRLMIHVNDIVNCDRRPMAMIAVNMIREYVSLFHTTRIDDPSMFANVRKAIYRPSYERRVNITSVDIMNELGIRPYSIHERVRYSESALAEV